MMCRVRLLLRLGIVCGFRDLFDKSNSEGVVVVLAFVCCNCCEDHEDDACYAYCEVC